MCKHIVRILILNKQYDVLNASIEQLLLQPRSAPENVWHRVSPCAHEHSLHCPTHCVVLHFNTKIAQQCFLWLGHTWLSNIHFRGQWLRRVSCYTLLSWFQLSWQRSCCLQPLTPFVGSIGPLICSLTQSIGSFQIASTAYQIMAHTRSFVTWDSTKQVKWL